MVDAVGDAAPGVEALIVRAKTSRRRGNHPVRSAAEYIIRKAEEKIRHRHAEKRHKRQHAGPRIEFCLTATTIPIGIATTHAKIMLASARMTVLNARAAMSEVTLTR